MRSDHPWGSSPLQVKDPATGASMLIDREGETDVLVVVQATDGKRIGLHIENKVLNGRFKRHQPELYKARAQKWIGNPRYGSDDEWTTVLVAPRDFAQRFQADAAHFGSFMAHEDLARHIPLFGELD